MEVLRFACPLRRFGEHYYGFVHASMIEYFATRAMYEKIQQTEPEEVQVKVNDKEKEEKPDELVYPREDNKFKRGIHYRVFSQERNAIQFLADRIEMSEEFKQKMLLILEASKKSLRFANGAANAITSLVRAGITFNGANLAGIKISGADISGGYFAGTNLEESDLTNVRMMCSFLMEANLRKCLLDRVNFDEYPWFHHEDAVREIDYRSTLNCMATASGNNIYIWDFKSWQCIKIFEGHEKTVNSIHLSLDGTRLVSGSDDGRIKVWNLVGDEVVTLFHETFFRVYIVSSNDDGSQVISAHQDEVIRIWNVASGKFRELGRFKHQSVKSLQFTMDGWCVVFKSESNTTVSAYHFGADEINNHIPDNIKKISGYVNFITLKELSIGSNKVYIHASNFSSDKKNFVSNGKNYSVLIWDVESRKIVKQFNGHQDVITDVSFNIDATKVVSGSVDRTIRVWDVHSGESIVLNGHRSGVNIVQFINDERQILSGSDDGTVRVWDITELNLKVQRGHVRSINIINFNNDGTRIASGSEEDDSNIRIWEVASGNTKVLSGHTALVNTVQFSQDGQRLVTCSKDNTTRIWDLNNGEVKILEGPKRIFMGRRKSKSQFCADENYVITKNTNSTIWKWDLTLGKPYVLGKIETYTEFSRNGRWVISIGKEQTVHVFDVTNGETKILKRDTSLNKCMQISEDGLTLIAGDGDNIRVWNVISGESKVFSGHEKSISSVKFNSANTLLVSGGEDQCIRVWNIANGHSIVLKGHEASIISAQFSEDDALIFSRGKDQAIRIWDIQEEKQIKALRFNQNMTSFALHESQGLLSIGFNDGTIQCWQCIDDSWESLQLKWGSSKPNDLLVLTDCDILNSKGLSAYNLRLLEQRGALVDGEILKSKFIFLNGNHMERDDASDNKIGSEYSASF